MSRCRRRRRRRRRRPLSTSSWARQGSFGIGPEIVGALLWLARSLPKLVGVHPEVVMPFPARARWSLPELAGALPEPVGVLPELVGAAHE